VPPRLDPREVPATQARLSASASWLSPRAIRNRWMSASEFLHVERHCYKGVDHELMVDTWARRKVLCLKKLVNSGPDTRSEKPRRDCDSARNARAD